MTHYHPTKWQRDKQGNLTGRTYRRRSSTHSTPGEADAVAYDLWGADAADAFPCKCGAGE